MSNLEKEIKQYIIDLEKSRYQYLLNEDYEKFTRLCHPQLRYVHASGIVDDFEGYTEKCNQGFYKYKQADLKIEEIALFNDVATIFSELNTEFYAGTQVKKLHLKIAAIWVKQDDDWKFFSYQPTSIM